MYSGNIGNFVGKTKYSSLILELVIGPLVDVEDYEDYFSALANVCDSLRRSMGFGFNYNSSYYNCGWVQGREQGGRGWNGEGRDWKRKREKERRGEWKKRGGLGEDMSGRKWERWLSRNLLYVFVFIFFYFEIIFFIEPEKSYLWNEKLFILTILLNFLQKNLFCLCPEI